MANPFPIKVCPQHLASVVDGFEGDCVPVWLNRNRFYNIVDGGTTGFFKKTMKLLPGVYLTIGKQFHGIIRRDYDEKLKVFSTEGML